MSTITHHGSIRKSKITLSAQGHRPLTQMPIWTMHRQSPRWVSKSTSSTTFAGFQGTTSGKYSRSSWWTERPWWPPRPVRSSPSSSNRKLQSKERMGSLQKLCSLQRSVAEVVMMVMVVMAVKPVKAAEAQRGIREMIREIVRTRGKRRISRSAFIASGEGIPLRTAWPSNVVILLSQPTLQQTHRLRLLQLSPLRSRTIGWWLAQMLHLAIGSSIADARLTSPAVNQCSSTTPHILWIRSRWRDSMGSHRLHPDMEVLGWLASCQMERRKWSYFKKWCICWDPSTSSHNLRSWARTSKSNRWISTVTTSKMARASWLQLQLRSRGY